MQVGVFSTGSPSVVMSVPPAANAVEIFDAKQREQIDLIESVKQPAIDVRLVGFPSVVMSHWEVERQCFPHPM